MFYEKVNEFTISKKEREFFPKLTKVWYGYSPSKCFKTKKPVEGTNKLPILNWNYMVQTRCKE